MQINCFTFYWAPAVTVGALLLKRPCSCICNQIVALTPCRRSGADSEGGEQNMERKGRGVMQKRVIQSIGHRKYLLVFLLVFRNVIWNLFCYIIILRINFGCHHPKVSSQEVPQGIKGPAGLHFYKHPHPQASSLVIFAELQCIGAICSKKTLLCLCSTAFILKLHYHIW